MPIDRTIVKGTDSIITDGIDRVVISNVPGGINGHIDGVNTHIGVHGHISDGIERVC